MSVLSCYLGASLGDEKIYFSSQLEATAAGGPTIPHPMAAGLGGSRSNITWYARKEKKEKIFNQTSLENHLSRTRPQ